MSTETLKTRQEVPEELKWDLTDIYETEEAFEAVLEQVPADVESFANTYNGKLTNKEIVLEAIHSYEEITITMTQLALYARLPITTDLTDSEAQQRYRKVNSVLAELGAKLSFFHSQVQALGEEILDGVVESDPAYKTFIRNVKKAKTTQLAPEVEKVLTGLEPVFGAPADIFEQARSADMDFGTFEVDGKEYPLSFVIYEEVYMYHEDPKLRRAAYDKFCEVLAQYQNVVATAYYTHVQREKTIATMRGYDSVIDYLLDKQDVDRSVYNRQIDMIMNDFAPVMRKYITHVKESVGLEKMTYADLKIDLDPEYSQSVSIEESKELVEKALSPMGDEYVEKILRAYPERWIDFAQNKGKRSGAFCNTSYGTHPYVFVSYTGQLQDCYTLFHELGHAGHGILRNAHNPVTAARPSLYLIEGPSTFHELLLTDYLKENASDPRRERYILSKMISRTYFHNFVTHLLEAAYQREVYKLIDAGKSFDAKKLSELKREVLEQFWGDAVELEPGAELTWMRQQHYYKGLYPYTYSAGLTIATQAFLKIKKEEVSMDGWMEFLKMGGTQVPKDATKVAGVDITTDQPLADTIQYLDESIERMIALSKEL
jgi:oligoendopeptidase F